MGGHSVCFDRQDSNVKWHIIRLERKSAFANLGFNFFFHYIWKAQWQESNLRNFLPTNSLLKCPHQPVLGQAEAKSPELNLDIQCGLRAPN